LVLVKFTDRAAPAAGGPPRTAAAAVEGRAIDGGGSEPCRTAPARAVGE